MMEDMLIVLLALLYTVSAMNYHSPPYEMLSLAERSDMREVGRASTTRRHTVIFEMAIRNEDKLEETLIDVSDPKSKNWGKHWTRDEIAKFFGPVDGAVESVRAYLGEHTDVTFKVSAFEEFVTATASVEVWETVFSTEFVELNQFVA